MTKKQLAALQRIIDREASRIAWGKERLKETDQDAMREAGLHPSRDRFVVTDGNVAVIFRDKPEDVHEAERMDGLYDIMRTEIEFNDQFYDHLLALTVTAEHISEWKKQSKPWKAGKTNKTGLKDSTTRAMCWMLRRLSALVPCSISAGTARIAPSVPCWYSQGIGWRTKIM